jgi:hypothetical protein
VTAVGTRRCFAEKRDANAAGMVKPDRRERVGRAQHDRTLGGSHVLVFVSGGRKLRPRRARVGNSRGRPLADLGLVPVPGDDHRPIGGPFTLERSAGMRGTGVGWSF